MPVVLVLTQEPSIDQLCWQALSRVGHEVISVKTVAEAIHASLAVKISVAARPGCSCPGAMATDTSS